MRVGGHVGVAGERERDLLALVAAERGHQRRVDVVDLDLRRVALDPIGEIDGIAGLRELTGPDDIDRRKVIALGVADVVGGDLGE